MKKVIMLLSNPFKPDPRVYKEARSLVNNGYDVTVLAWDREGKYPKKEVIDGIKIERIRLKSKYGNTLELFFLLPLWQFIAFFKLLNRRYDLLHCHDFDTLTVGILLKKIKNKKIIYDAHESYPDMIKSSIPTLLYKFIFALESFYLKKIDYLITVNKILKEYFEKRGTSKTETIMNCYDKQDFRIYQKKIDKITKQLNLKNKFVIVYIGVLIKDRGLRELVESFKYQKDDSIKLLIFGYGPIKNNLNKIVEKYNLQDKVFLLGEIHPTMVPSYISIGDLIPIIYKFNENNKFASPNKLFEAITLSKPLLVSDIGILGNFVRKFDCGIILESFDPKKIAETLKKIKNDYQLIEKMKKNTEKAYREYNWELESKKLLKIYEEVLR